MNEDMKFIEYRDHYLIYKKTINGKNYWYARHEDSTCPHRITVRQAKGHDPLYRMDILGREIGELLLPF